MLINNRLQIIWNSLFLLRKNAKKLNSSCIIHATALSLAPSRIQENLDVNLSFALYQLG